MKYAAEYPSPLGWILLAEEAGAVVGLWFAGQKYDRRGLEPGTFQFRETALLTRTKSWLDRYFAGEKPEMNLPLAPEGTEFQLQVWGLLSQIPCGQTRTYGDLAKMLKERGISASAQAVGGAVGRNPISILIPCHRVVGRGGRLTGYAGGLNRKGKLLALEGILLPETCQDV